MRIAQILYEKAHWIFTAEEIPNFPPDAEGNPIFLIDITDKPEVQEGWDYDAETNTFSEPELPEPITASQPSDPLAELKELQLIQMEAQAEISEQAHENTLIIFEALADIFEEIGGM